MRIGAEARMFSYRMWVSEGVGTLLVASDRRAMVSRIVLLRSLVRSLSLRAYRSRRRKYFGEPEELRRSPSVCVDTAPRVGGEFVGFGVMALLYRVGGVVVLSLLEQDGVMAVVRVPV